MRPAFPLLLAFAPALAAAPQLPPPRPAGDAPPDVVTGAFELDRGCPVLKVCRPTPTGFAADQVWLVFPTEQLEAAAVRALAPGTPVRATGRLGRGGSYRYLTVHALEDDR